jgi:twinkle protein
MAEHKHKPCPYVDCGSSDAFGYNDEGFGSCFSCGRSYPSGDRMYDWAKERYPVKENNYKFDESSGSYGKQGSGSDQQKEVGSFVATRGIDTKTMQKFGVLTYGGITQEYVYPSGGIKCRRLDSKQFYAKNGFKGDELFGMNLFPSGCAKNVTVTEGELDALSVDFMLRSNYITPVPSATPSKKFWENCKEWLDSFDKITLSVDNDEAGNALADQFSRIFPNKVYRVNHGSYKDANAMLTAGKGQEFKSAWFNARKHIPENILNSSEDFLNLYRDTPEHQYVPTGINALDDVILGLMQGHFTVIKAKTGIGKTEIMRFLEHQMIRNKIPFAAWHLEETKLRSLLGLVSYDLCDNLTRRDLIEFKGRHKDVEQSIVDLTKDEIFYQFYLMDGQGADELIEQIRYFSQVCGCKFVFFEPIQDVVSGQTDENKEALLADLAVRLSKLAAELNIGIVTIAHTNENGDIKYCKMIGQRASVIIDLNRDKMAEDFDTRNTTFITVEKNRPCSQEGPAGKMKFNPDTFTLREVM